MKKLLLVLSVIFHLSLFGQNTFQLKIKSDFFKRPEQIAIMHDTSTVVSYYESDTSIKKIIYVKVDKQGKILWSKKYFTLGTVPLTSSIIATENNDFIASVVVPDSLYNYLIIFRADNMGNILWQKKINAPVHIPYERVNGMLTNTKDNGFYLLYSITDYSPVTPVIQNYILKFDKNANLEWQNHFTITDKYSNSIRVTNITATSDDGIVVAATYEYCEAYCSYLELHKFNSNGLPDWNYTYHDQIYTYYDLYPVQLLTEDDKGNIVVILKSAFGLEEYHYIFAVLDTLTGKAVKYTVGQSLFSLQAFLKKTSAEYIKGKSFAFLNFRNSRQYSPINIYGFNYDWSLVNASLLEPDDKTENIFIEKYDETGKICPDYKLPYTRDSAIIGEMEFTANDPYLSDAEEVNITDSRELISAAENISVKELCNDQKTDTVIIRKHDSTSYVKDSTFKPVIFPNPARSNINISVYCTAAGQYKLEISDLTGKLLKQRLIFFQAGQNTINENIASLSKGMYLIKLSSQSRSKTLKLIKN